MIAVEPLAERLLTWLGSLSLQAAVLVALALLLALSVRRASPRLRHLIWLVVLLRLAVPVELFSPFGLLAPPAPEAMAALGATRDRMELLAGEVVATTSLDAPPAQPSITPGQASLESSGPAPWLAVSWLVGVILLLGVVGGRVHRARRQLAAAADASASLLAEVSELSRRLGIEPPRVKIADRATRLPSPAAFGLRRPTILLPESLVTSWTAGEREPLLVHELAHLRRRDLWVNSLQLVVQTLYFFHPLVWFANRNLRVARELACDEDVARFYGAGSNRYARALLRAARGEDSRHSSALAVTLAAPRSLLGRRVERLLTRRGSNPRRQRATLIAVMAGSLAIVALATARPTRLAAELDIPTDTEAWLAFVEDLRTDPERGSAAEIVLIEQVRTGAGDPELLDRTLEMVRYRRSPMFGDPELRSAWEERMEILPNDLPTLRAAASFFIFENRDRARELLGRGWELEPGSVDWPVQLARLEDLDRMALSATDRVDASKRALDLLLIARPGLNESQLYGLLSFFARVAYGAGETTLASEYAQEMLAAAERRGEGWNYGNAIHHGHTVLGLVALAEGDRDEAARRLLLAGDTPGSPQLNSFGPSFDLAADLLDLGERQVVLDYLGRCAAFWTSSRGRLESWATEVAAGKRPSFRGRRY